MLPQRAVARPARSVPVTTCHGRREDRRSRSRRRRPTRRATTSDDHGQRRQDSSPVARRVHRGRRPQRAAAVASASAAAASRRAGVRLDDDGHLPAGVRGAGEAVGRAPARTAGGSSGPASSASGRRSAARRRRLRSSSTSCTPSVRRIVSGRISTLSPAMRRAQVPFGISNSSSRESTCTGASAAHAERGDQHARPARSRAPARRRTHGRHRRASSSSQVVHVVLGGAAVGHQRAQPAVAVDQVDRRRVVDSVAARAIGTLRRRRRRSPCAPRPAARRVPVPPTKVGSNAAR